MKTASRHLQRWHRQIWLLSVLSLGGCDLVGDIFQAGLLVGIIAVIAIVALVFWIISLFRGRGAP